MKTILSLLSFLVILNFTTAQSPYLSGYYVNNDGERIEGLIQNKDWLNNPDRINYKATVNAKPKELDISKILEFGIDDICRYERHDVVMDVFDDRERMKYKETKFDYQNKVIFLKVLVSGKATLYRYNHPDFQRFFYQMDDETPIQLDDKINKRTDLIGTKLEYNKQFRIQLYQKLKCENLTINQFANLRLKKKNLIKLFTSYNECIGVGSQNYSTKIKRNSFNFNIRFGVGLMDLNKNAIPIDFRNPFSPIFLTFENEVSFKYGVELEYILPFRNGNWSLTVEPAYLSFSRADSILRSIQPVIEYKAIQIAFGPRYNYNISSNTRIYATVVNVPEFPLSGSNLIITPDNPSPWEARTSVSPLVRDFAFGVGIISKRFNLEVRYHTTKLIDFDALNQDYRYGVTYLNLGYRLW